MARKHDLSGKKISAPGALGLWLKGSGAVPVDGSLTSYYTDIQTGVSEGTISIATGILPSKVYEVAPYVTTVDIGALYNGGMAINKDTFNGMPPEVQKIIIDGVAEEPAGRSVADIAKWRDRKLVDILKVSDAP